MKNILTVGLVTTVLLTGASSAAVLITELDHNPDYIEVTNTSSSAVDVSGWSLSIQDDNYSNWSFTFNAGSILQSGESFGIADVTHSGAAYSDDNIPNASNRGIYAYVTDSVGLLYDAVSIVSGSDTGGTIPTNYPTFIGTVNWRSASTVTRVSDERFTSSSFSTTDVESPISSTNLEGTTSESLAVIVGVSSVPEPSSFLLLGLGTMGLISRRSRSKGS